MGSMSKPLTASTAANSGASKGPSPAVMGTYARQNIVFARGEGAWLETEAGERYLDFGSGVAVNALGHAHPRLVRALTEQAGKLWHTSNLYRVEGQEKLAARLVEVTFADKVFFCNSGAEACEGAIKAARRYHFVSGHPERWRIVTCTGAFHGRTLATLAAAGNPKYLEGFGPEAPGFDHVPFGDLEALRAAIGPETAAIMVEPVQGEGGVNVGSAEYLRGLRALCDEVGILLVLDEVQTGVGRTGRLFSHEWAGITPDIMAVAKGIGGGFPLGAVLATERAAAGLTPGTHGSTFGGNPLATAVGCEVLDVVLEPGFLEGVQQKALRLRQSLARIQDQFPDLVTEVRGQGLLAGIKVNAAPADVVAAALGEKLLVVGAGDNVVRVLPPLTVGEDEIAEGIDRLGRALAHVSKADASQSKT
jgi:acetylornithine/N-succinyldiaminopimelate aminotransferase